MSKRFGRELDHDEDHPCPCEIESTRCLTSEFHELKGDHSGELEITYECEGCNCIWTRTIWMSAGTVRFNIFNEPFEEELEEDEDPCICIPDEPNPMCESCF